LARTVFWRCAVGAADRGAAGDGECGHARQRSRPRPSPGGASIVGAPCTRVGSFAGAATGPFGQPAPSGAAAVAYAGAAVRGRDGRARAFALRATRTPWAATRPAREGWPAQQNPRSSSAGTRHGVCLRIISGLGPWEVGDASLCHRVVRQLVRA